MYVVVGWPYQAQFDRALATHTLNVCAEVRRVHDLDGVLLTLPPATDPLARRRALATLQSLRGAGVHSAGIMVSSRGLQPDDIDECLATGVGDFVFVEDSPAEARATLGVVGRSRLPTMVDARVRIWLGDVHWGSYQHQLAAWISAFDFSVEIVPLPFDSVHSPVAALPSPSSGNAALACEWLRSVVTIAENGWIMPCPAHRVEGGCAFATGDPAVVLATLAEWRGSLAENGTCRSCDRRVRFGIADWLGRARISRARAASEGPEYRDYVGRDAAKAPTEELRRLIEEFAERIASNDTGGPTQ